MLYPLKFEPIYKEKIWGGDKLKKVLGKDIPEGKKIGESWEISDHFEDTGIVANGDLKGKTLHELLIEYKEKLVGLDARREYFEKFPLLIKFIDASDKLSVQVHPDNKYAEEHEKGEWGKTEMWYVVHAEQDAGLIAGFEKEITKEEFMERVKENKLDDVLHRIDVKTGDVLFIPAGRIHAMLRGVLINEIQQNSDLTYRIYDWGRVGFDGKPRPLHIEKAIDVINFNDIKPELEKVSYLLSGKNKIYTLVKCEFFTTEKLELEEPITAETAMRSFNILCIITGNGKIRTLHSEVEYNKGESILIPAEVTPYKIIPESRTVIIRSML